MSSSIACVDYRDGKVLIAKRMPGGDMGNRWEFPGGKIEEGENFQQAIKREMMEEFSSDVQVFEQIAEGSFIHKEKKCFLTAFRIHFEKDGINQPFVLTEHTDTQWYDINKIQELNFVDSDLMILDQVKKSLGL